MYVSVDRSGGEQRAGNAREAEGAREAERLFSCQAEPLFSVAPPLSARFVVDANQRWRLAPFKPGHQGR